jgi:UTP--glucose-1-phosphate uridylyltransferase
LTDALKAQCKKENVYSCIFEGKRYDAGDKLGYLEATVEYALESPQLGQKFAQYLEELFKKRKYVKTAAEITAETKEAMEIKNIS